MNQQNDAPLSAEDELNIERIHRDLQRQAVANSTGPEIDTSSIAVKAVEQYWKDRAAGIIDREGEPIPVRTKGSHRVGRFLKNVLSGLRRVINR